MSDICLSLDLNTAIVARSLAERVDDLVWGYKIGHRLLLTRDGLRLAGELMKTHPVILDLKLHDTPGAVAATLDRLDSMAEYHSSSLIYVTVWADSLADVTPIHVDQLAVWSMTTDSSLRYYILKNVIDEGKADGLVCPATAPTPKLARDMMRDVGNHLPIFSPGIRLASNDVHDQRYVATPGQARDAGASVLIVGRPVLEGSHPRETLRRMIEEE